MSLFLSRLFLSGWRYDVRDDLKDCCRMHMRLLHAFPDGPDISEARSTYGVLYRLEPHTTLIVQSQHRPDWSVLPDGYLRQDAQVKEIAPHLETGQMVRFRLRGNPWQYDATRKRRAIHDEEGLRAWIHQYGGYAGLTIAEAEMTPELPITGMHRTSGRITVVPVRYDGVAEVTDPAATHHALAAGLGRGKAYGCALLSLAPAQG